jgi:hypothetical protein
MNTERLLTPEGIVDELTYINYSANRAAFPHISPDQMKKVGYPNVDAMEARFQAEKAIGAAKAEADIVGIFREEGLL